MTEVLIRITYRSQVFEVEPRLTLLEALEKIGLEPEMVLAIRGGEMIGGEALLETGDEVRLISVIAGG
jgi:sulfur carrier protein ThiS